MPGRIVPLALLVVALAVAAVVLSIRREAGRYHREVMENGSPFVARVVMTHDSLYTPGDSHGASARVLVAFDRGGRGARRPGVAVARLEGGPGDTGLMVMLPSPDAAPRSGSTA